MAKSDTWLRKVGRGIKKAGEWITGESARKHNVAMMHQQREWSLEDWHRQNEYNHPQAQMDRLQSAGLNPHLVYGDGATTQAAPTPKMPEAADYSHGQMPLIGTSLMQFMQGQLLGAQTSKVRQEAENFAQDNEWKAFDNAVRMQVGVEKIAERQMSQLSHANQKDAKEVREFQAWAQQMFGLEYDMNTDSMTEYQAPGDQLWKLNVDSLGTYQFDAKSNQLINMAQRLNFGDKVNQWRNERKRGVLYDDQHGLNKLETEIRDFKANLAELGLNDQTLKGATILLQALQLVFGSRSYHGRIN